LSVSKGREAEDLAVSYLFENGFSVVSRNVYVGKKEIDIIAMKAGVLHFIEVKSGSGFEPLDNMTHKKLSNLIYAINTYVSNHKLESDYVLDVLVVRDRNIELIENITV